MQSIPQYNAPPGTIRPNEAGEAALDLEARMSGRLGEERGALIRQGGEALDRGLHAAGEGVGTLGEVVTHYAGQQEILGGLPRAAQVLDTLNQYHQQLIANSDPFDPTVHERYQSTVNEVMGEFANSFQTPLGRAWATQHAANLSTELYRQGVAADVQRAQDAAHTSIAQTTNTLSNLVAKNPNMLDTALQMIPSTMDVLEQHAPGLKASGLGQQMGKSIVAAAIQSTIEQNMDAGIRLANDPKYSSLLSAQERDMLIRHGEAYQKMTEVQNRMIAADNRRQEKDAADQAMNQVAASVVQPNGQIVPPANMPTNIAAIMTKYPGTSPELGASMLKWADVMTRDAAAGKNDVTNDVIGNNFATRAFLPPNDPHALTYKDVFDAKAQHELSNADFARFNQAIGHNQKSDLNGQMENKMVFSALNQAAGMLGYDPTMASGATGVQAAGAAAYNRLLQWFTPAYQAAIRKGISPSEAVEKLLDPERIATFKAAPQANPGSGIGGGLRSFFFSTPEAQPVPPAPEKTSHDLSVIFGGK